MVDEIPLPDRREGEKVGFWLDTLCVPVRRPFYHEKKLSIQRMRHVYESAAAVLVVDSWLGQITSEAPVPDLCLSIYLSDWQRRLWTFQEGCLARNVYFRFGDKAEHHQKLTEKRVAYENLLETRGIYSKFCALSDSEVTIHFTLIKAMVGMYATGDDTRENMWMLYLPLAGALGRRQTTKLSDETLYLSAILAIDPGPFLNIRGEKDESDEKLAERRMKKFLQEFKTFNSSLIFNNYPRMSQNGFRWAPRSLLGARPSSTGMIEDQLEGRLKRIGPNNGLVVKYPGTKCKLADLLSTKEGDKKTFFITEKGPGTDMYYSIESQPSNCRWDRQAVYGLVFATKPHPEEKSVAIIGNEVAYANANSDDKKEDIHFLRYECNAIVRGISGPAPLNALALSIYEKKTKWMIM